MKIVGRWRRPNKCLAQNNKEDLLRIVLAPTYLLDTGLRPKGGCDTKHHGGEQGKELRLAAERGIREYLQTIRGLRQFGSNAVVENKDNHSFVVIDDKGERYRVIIRH